MLRKQDLCEVLVTASQVDRVSDLGSNRECFLAHTLRIFQVPGFDIDLTKVVERRCIVDPGVDTLREQRQRLSVSTQSGFDFAAALVRRGE